MVTTVMAYNNAGKTNPLFQKRTVAELTDGEMLNVNGGTSAVCAAIWSSSAYCGGVAFGVTLGAGAIILGGIVGFLDGITVE
jgi:hypothetical protein